MPAPLTVVGFFAVTPNPRAGSLSFHDRYFAVFILIFLSVLGSLQLAVKSTLKSKEFGFPNVLISVGGDKEQNIKKWTTSAYQLNESGSDIKQLGVSTTLNSSEEAALTPTEVLYPFSLTVPVSNNASLDAVMKVYHFSVFIPSSFLRLIKLSS